MATALLEQPKVKEPQENQSEPDPVPYHWTVDALERATEAGVFDHPERLELVHGRIIENVLQSAPHTSLRRRIGRRLQGAMEPTYLVMEKCPLRLALDGEPVPDVIVVSGREEDYAEKHPTQAVTVLVVEVCNSTMVYDLGEKAVLYAQANIADYWKVLVNENAVVVHRDPTPSGYSRVTRLAGADTLSPLALPEAVWTIDTLLGRENAPEEH